MTDLEYAARAAGYIDDHTSDEDAHGLHRGVDGGFYVVHAGGWYAWDPENDSGDAFNLMADLNMDVDVERATGTVWVSAGICDGVRCEAIECDVVDYRAAARRVIFSVAVQAGKAMP